MTTLGRIPLALIASLGLPVSTLAQDSPLPQTLAQETFVLPSDSITNAVLAPRHLNVTLGNPSPDGVWLVSERGDGPPSMALFAKPFHRLGGLQIDWAANRDRRRTLRSDAVLTVTNVATGATTEIDVPAGARVSSPIWSPDGSRLGFFAHFDDATHVYVADPASGRVRQLTRSPVLATLYDGFTWTPDSRSIVTVLVPEGRGPAPEPPAIPTGPQVRITTPEENRIRTYPDLLENPFEQDLLEYYATGQLAVIDVERRRVRLVGSPAMISGVDVSPTGAEALVSTMRRPFSYIVPVSSFPGAEEVWSLGDGSVLALVAEQDVRDGEPDDTTNGNGDPERRSVAWRPDGSLGFLQLAPRANGEHQGDTERSEEGRRSRRIDRVMRWRAPFDGNAIDIVFENRGRLENAQYTRDPNVLILTEEEDDEAHQYAVLLDDPNQDKRTITRGDRPRFGRGFGPQIVLTTTESGTEVVQLTPDGQAVYVIGRDNADEPMAEGPVSYLERVPLHDGERERLFESDNDGVWEDILAVLDPDATTLLVTRESPTDVPDSYLRHRIDATVTPLTENVDYTPDITNARRTRYAVTRVDGFEFAVDVTLPRDWSGEPLPGMIWFYPREYTDQETYDETRERYNKNAFPSLRERSMDILVRAGYAVIEPDAPIIGDEGRMNDNYVHDLRNNLSATIDFLDEEGIIDRERLGVGGHSYGAFSTVNAMVHTPFFKAGIAGDGNYNRTLTPFAFQTERRSVWQQRDLYFSISPIFYANNLNGALLMYHGEHDQNVGTFPINSWRLFEALESLGKTASLYVYPFEDHGPATEETLLDLWGRWTSWLDRYVKNAGREPAAAAENVTSDGP